MTFQEKLFQLRRAREYSQEQLARELGVSRQAISPWELGEVIPDTANVLPCASSSPYQQMRCCGRMVQRKAGVRQTRCPRRSLRRQRLRQSRMLPKHRIQRQKSGRSSGISGG